MEGYTLAVGAPRNDAGFGNSESGHVRVLIIMVQVGFKKEMILMQKGLMTYAVK